jgi:hypothetical protein
MNVVEQTNEILQRHAPWIVATVPKLATARQEPRDLIAVALRIAGFDIFASASKATEIMNKEAVYQLQQTNYDRT